MDIAVKKLTMQKKFPNNMSIKKFLSLELFLEPKILLKRPCNRMLKLFRSFLVEEYLKVHQRKSFLVISVKKLT